MLELLKSKYLHEKLLLRQPLIEKFHFNTFYSSIFRKITFIYSDLFHCKVNFTKFKH